LDSEKNSDKRLEKFKEEIRKELKDLRER